MKCPFCENEDTKVIDSRHTEEGTAIRRRRECEKCGKLLHIDRSEIEEMARLLEERSGFRMDNVQTVLYGVCGDCKED